MSTIAPYPHVDIDLEDRSIYEAVSEETTPLHKPIYFTRARRGPIGIPIWRDTLTLAKKTFGSLTFDQKSEYFSPSAYFLKKTFTNNGAFIVRVADSDTKEARLVIELAVTPKDVQQFQRDENGKFVYDEDGEKIAINEDGAVISTLQATYDAETAAITAGTITSEQRTVLEEDLVPYTIPGYQLAWYSRALPQGASEDVDFEDLTPTVVTGEGGVATTYYPMFTFVAANGGKWGNNFGFRLYYDKSVNTGDTITRNGACYYKLAPVELVEGNATASSIRDKYSNTEVQFVIKPDAVDATTGVAIDAATIMGASYSGDYELPLKMTVFSENFNTVGNLILAADEQAREDLAIDYDGNGVNDWDTSEQGYMVNLFSNVDINGVTYRAVELTEPDGLVAGLTAMSSATIQYMKGGADGDISDAATEEYIRIMLADTTNEYLIDKPRFPFNCMFDTGFSMETKRAMMAFLDVREDVKIYLGTQVSWKDASGKIPAVNSRYIDESVGAALRSEVLAMRESIAKGTGCCRAAIFLEAGKTADWDRWLPATLWIAMKKAEYLNVDYMKKEPKELPNSDVSIWKETSWTATSEDTRSRLWNFGLNYMQYYNSKNVHYAALRSVYVYDTSVLVDDSFTDAVTFIKQLTYPAWAKFSGSTDAAASLNQRIYEHLTEKYQYMLNGKFGVEVEVYQTDEDVKLGFVRHIDVHLSSAGQNRVWKVNIIAERDGYTAED